MPVNDSKFAALPPHQMEQVLERKGVAAGNITRPMLRYEIQSLLAEVGLHSTTATDPEIASQPSGSPRHYHILGWGEGGHLLPKNFEFPSIDPLGAWMLQWFDDQRRGCPPYNGIFSDNLDTTTIKATHSEWSIMVRHIVNGIKDKLHVPMPSKSHATELFQRAQVKTKQV
ncbi:hypothetical protein JG687_00008898 [Phytophthora cactorum]|uniref:Uncharacterized protein n=1 Tax=Phytophthora cactorum TaxID=29920 RepID=A0A8T1UGG3_9STRA|nr:hypothetical protein JG687_00008898 [Phytophthora cactorum]